MNTTEINFAYKVRHALNEHLDNLPISTTDRLACAREIALSRKKTPTRVLAQQGILAGSMGRFFNNPFSWLMRASIVAPILIGVGLLSGLYQYEQQHHLSAIADIDAAVLSDEVPPSAYLDRGFTTYLSQQDE